MTPTPQREKGTGRKVKWIGEPLQMEGCILLKIATGLNPWQFKSTTHGLLVQNSILKYGNSNLVKRNPMAEMSYSSFS